MTQVSIYMRDELIGQLDVIAKKERRARSQLIAIFIEDCIRRYNKEAVSNGKTN